MLASTSKRATFAVVAGALSTLLLIPIAAADKPPTEWDGLQQTKSKRVQLLYVRPGATLQGYKLVRLEPLQVEFDKNWDPNSSRHGAARLTADDFAKMKKNLATIFHEQCGKDLAKGGYKLSTQAGDDVLDVTPIVVDLYVAAPDKMTPGRSYTYVADPGRMTLVAELRDSDTNQVIARAIDKRAATGWGGQFQISSSVSNRAAAEQIISRWCGALRDALDDANGK